MTKNEEAPVIVPDAETMPTEVLAASIVRISEAATKLQASGLNRHGLLVLLKAATGLHMNEIGRVLDALPKLAALYTIPKKGSEKPKRRSR